MPSALLSWDLMESRSRKADRLFPCLHHQVALVTKISVDAGLWGDRSSKDFVRTQIPVAFLCWCLRVGGRHSACTHFPSENRWCAVQGALRANPKLQIEQENMLAQGVRESLSYTSAILGTRWRREVKQKLTRMHILVLISRK